MNTIYSDRKASYLKAFADYRAACARHAARLNSPGAMKYFSSQDAVENRRAIKLANKARERARRVFDAVATDEDKAAMLLDAIAEQDAFTQAMS